MGVSPCTAPAPRGGGGGRRPGGVGVVDISLRVETGEGGCSPLPASRHPQWRYPLESRAREFVALRRAALLSKIDGTRLMHESPQMRPPKGPALGQDTPPAHTGRISRYPGSHTAQKKAPFPDQKERNQKEVYIIFSSRCSRKSSPLLISSIFFPPVRMILPELKRRATIFGFSMR